MGRKKMGRPKIDEKDRRLSLSVRVKKDVLEYLREKGAGVTIEEVVIKTADFKRWIAANSKAAKKRKKKTKRSILSALQ